MGFRVPESHVARRIEGIVSEFLNGYHAALETSSTAGLGTRLNFSAEPEYRGFAFEGAGMALFILDQVALPRRRFETFVQGPGDPHAYICHVGAGWAVARLPWLRFRIDRTLESFDPLMRWLVLDGYGFHEGFFHCRERVTQAKRPARLTGYAARAFDQGLGRSLWFVDGMDSTRVPQTIGAFPFSRHSDLWSGVGLACAYAGGADRSGIERLLEAAGPHRAAFQQGVAFAAEARERAGNPTGHLEMVCQAACESSSSALAGLCQDTMKHLPADGAEPSYEIWRRRIQSEFAGVRR